METRIPLEILDNSDAVTRYNIQSVIDDFTGATSENNGVRGFVPAPPQGSQNNFLRGDGTWSNAAVVDQSVSSSNGNYPILLVPVSDASTSQSNQTVIFAPGVSVNPSTGNITATSFTGDFTGDISGNADTATSLANDFIIELTGDVSGFTSTNGTGTAIVETIVEDDSHNHIISNVDGLQDELDGKAALNHTHAADDITSGTFDASVIPSLDASKITSGSFNAARIPNLDASKITTGTFDSSTIPELDASIITTGTFNAARIPNIDASKITGTFDESTIPNLDASKITTGTFNTARIPNLDASKITGGTFNAARIPNLDASKITSGTIDIARLPAGALERCVVVDGESGRFALTTNDVQTGDTVKQVNSNGTSTMYFVVDDTKLSSEDGYEEYTAGTATSVPWSGVTGKPSTFTPASHTHGNISNTGTLADTSKAVVTDQNGKITTSANTTLTEIGYVHGVTSAIQTQLNGKAAVSHEHAASDITSGTLNANQIPTLDASKIGSGVFSADRIPSIAPASHTHGNISNTGTLSGTSKVVITNQSGKITTSTNTTTTELEYVHGVTSAIQTQLDGKAAVNHEHDASEITSGTFSANQIPGLDASKIVSGVLSIDRIPADAKPKMVVVADETARFALTTSQVRNGDLVKQLDNQTVYYVVDETKLNLPAGYEEYTAPAADVSWNDIEDKPSSFTPASHTHGLIQNNGTLNTANMAVVTNGSKQIAPSATVTATELGYVHGVTSAIQTQLDGKAASSHGTHVTYSTSNPAANGTASPGSANNVSRGDHVHPLQTTISGNAGTATKFASAQSVTLTGDVTGTASSQAGWSVATTLKNSGVTAGTYNNVTVNAKGIVTAGSNVQYCMHVDTLPSSTPANLVDGGILIVG